jgi:hypothetical protein
MTLKALSCYCASRANRLELVGRSFRFSNTLNVVNMISTRSIVLLACTAAVSKCYVTMIT